MVDPIGFVSEALVRSGALLERDAESIVAVLPSGLAKTLDLPEYARLYAGAESGAIGCGIGSPLLEKLVSQARASLPVAWASLECDAPRASHAASMAERFVVRNGVVDVTDVALGTGHYVVGTFAYAAEADDRQEGVVHVAQRADGRGQPDDAFTAALSPGSGALRPSAARFDASAAAPRLAWCAEDAVRRAIRGFVESVGKRQARDETRMTEYFAHLLEETRKPRRRQDPNVTEAKIAHLAAERDSKLADLPSRFTVRVTIDPAAFVCVVASVVRVTLRVRRRKGERTLALDLPAEAQALDALSCDGCMAATRKPAVCDDALHVLCERCLPTAQGRPTCRACRAR